MAQFRVLEDDQEVERWNGGSGYALVHVPFTVLFTLLFTVQSVKNGVKCDVKNCVKYDVTVREMDW